MNKNLFSYPLWKWPLENKRWLTISIIFLVLSLFLVGCVSSTTESGTENSPDKLTQTPVSSLPETTLTSTPIWTSATIPAITSTAEPETPSFSTLNTPTPTWTPTVAPLIAPTLIDQPELLIAVIEVKQKGDANEFHEVWLVDTLTGEKRLIFTTTSGTRLTQILWGDEQSSILYVAEIKGIGEGHPTWQLYAVNYELGSSQAFFAEPLDGVPRLLDTSAQGKWLRIWVDYFDPTSFEWWFINTEDGTVIRNDPADRYLSGFVWSPNKPDVFAYFQEATLDGDNRIPQRIIISETPNFEVLDIIEYQYTSFGSEPMLMWDMSTPEQIMFLTPGETFTIDLTERQWTKIAQDLDVFPGDGFTQLLKSPSGQWAITTTFIRVIQLQDTIQVVERFEDKIDQGHVFLSWYDNKDWIIIAAQDGKVQVYELGNLDLLKEINLNDYGFTSPRSSTVLAQPLE